MVAVLLGVVLAGCAAGGPSPALPPPPSTVSIGMREYSFTYSTPINRGRNVITLRNDGQRDHQFVLIRLPKDLAGTLDQQLHSAQRRPVDVLNQLPILHPGESTIFALDLAPGRYGFLSLVPTPDGVPEALKGMNADVRVS